MEEFEASVSHIWSTAQRILGIRCLLAKSQDARSGTLRIKFNGQWFIRGINAYSSSTGQGGKAQSLASAVADFLEPRDPSMFRSINAGTQICGEPHSRRHTASETVAYPQHCDKLTTAIRPTKRQKTSQDTAGELCYQEASPLHLLADVAVQEHTEPQSTGAVPCPGQHDVEAASGLFTLPDGSCLPIRYLEGQAARTEGIGTSTGAQEAPRGMSPECHNVMVPAESPSWLHMLSEAAGQAERQAAARDSPREKELDVFMDEILSEAFHLLAPLSPSSSCSAGLTFR